MSVQDLIWGMTYNNGFARLYRYEFRARDKGAGGVLIDSIRIEKPEPEIEPERPKTSCRPRVLFAEDERACDLAKEILASAWDFVSDVVNYTPDRLRAFVKTVAESTWVREADFQSGSQWRLWCAVVRNYSKWRRGE
jgi:hypothetical protein